MTMRLFELEEANSPAHEKPANDLLEFVDSVRVEAARRVDAKRRSHLGQYFTPMAVARFMASLFQERPTTLRIVDPGAGVGSLTAALVSTVCSDWAARPEEIRVTAFEVDPLMVSYSGETLRFCSQVCHEAGIRLHAEIRDEDFIDAAVAELKQRRLTGHSDALYNAAILNPPYRKIQSASSERRRLATVGIETSNLYSAFLWLSMRLLEPAGEMTAITPRSFCNGPYFKAFRKAFMDQMRFRRIHVYDSRRDAFSSDDVLQENIVFSAVKSLASKRVLVSSSEGPSGPLTDLRETTHDRIVMPEDPGAFVRIVPDKAGLGVREDLQGLQASLHDLHLGVSTRRVVDFRAKELLRETPGPGTVPLIYPCHFHDSYIDWPRADCGKPNALALGVGAASLLVPSGYYVLVKRFSAKEEQRRIVAAVLDPTRIQATRLGFENHTNYFHRQGAGIPEALAKGLAAFLNSSLVDWYFRQFSGHPQVNATDLRSLRYPPLAKLEALGRKIGSTFPSQDELDRLVEQELLGMTDKGMSEDARRKIEQGLKDLQGDGRDGHGGNLLLYAERAKGKQPCPFPARCSDTSFWQS